MLTESSTKTAFEDELAAFRPPSPIVFADEDIFEPEHQLFEQEREELDLELHIISNINQEITRNPLFYPALIREFGYDAVVPGTDITFRAFAAQHQGARERELREIHRLADEYAGADDELNPDDDPNLTPPSTPHPSAGVTPATCESLLPNTSGLLNEEREGSTDQSCNGHYNHTPDLGKWVRWWNTRDLARYTILDAKALDCNVTWLTKHKDTS